MNDESGKFIRNSVVPGFAKCHNNVVSCMALFEFKLKVANATFTNTCWINSSVDIESGSTG